MAETPGGGVIGGCCVRVAASPLLLLLILFVTAATGPTGWVSAAVATASVEATGGECYVCGPQSGLLAPDASPHAHDMKAVAAAPATPAVAATASHSGGGGPKTQDEEILSCAGFHESDPRYRRRCEPFMGCIREEDGDGREARTCGNADGDVCYLVNNITYCYCKEPLCNTRTRMAVGPVSASAMAAPPPAAAADRGGASPPPDDEDASFEHSGGGPPPRAPVSAPPPRVGTSAAPPPPLPPQPPQPAPPPPDATQSPAHPNSATVVTLPLPIFLATLLAAVVRL